MTQFRWIQDCLIVSGGNLEDFNADTTRLFGMLALREDFRGITDWENQEHKTVNFNN